MGTSREIFAGKGQTLPPGAGKLGMTLFLLALGVLFAASMVGYMVVRLRATAWPPPGSPRLPEGLWISTVILLASSVTMHRALSRARSLPVSPPASGVAREGAPSLGVITPGRIEADRRVSLWIWITFFAGIAFLVSQLLNWSHLLNGHHLAAQSNLYAFTFYMLSGLHGAHVLGGLVALFVTGLHANHGRYHRASHEGLVYMSMYWHFLDAVWIVMFAVMVIAA